MKQFVKTVALVTLIAVITSSVNAEDKKKKDKTQKGKNQLAATILKKLSEADLSDEQKSSIETLAKTWGPKINEAMKKGALTEEQKGKRQEAVEKAKADGKKGKEAQAAVNAALAMTEAQIEAKAASGKLRQEFMKAVSEILTPEQRKAAKLGGGQKGKGKKPEGKKPDGEKKRKKTEAK